MTTRLNESETEELLALLDRLICDQEDLGTALGKERAGELARTYAIVQNIADGVLVCTEHDDCDFIAPEASRRWVWLHDGTFALVEVER